MGKSKNERWRLRDVAGTVFLGLTMAVASLFVILVGVVFIETMIEGMFIDATDWLEGMVAFVLFVVVCAVTGVAAFYVLLPVSMVLSYGWTGLLTGERPPLFRRRTDNLTGILIHLPIAIVFGLLGFLWFQEGQSSAYVQFSTNGLLLCFAALFFGVAPLIPRLFFFFKDPKDHLDDAKEEGAFLPLAFVILLIFGISIALGVDAVARHNESLKDEFTMAYGEDYTLSSDGHKSKTTRLIIEPPADGTLIFKTYKCPAVFKDAGGQRIKQFPRKKLKEWGLIEDGSEMRVWAFEATAQQRIMATVEGDYCTAQYRLKRKGSTEP
jgi:hypothetical protein